MNTSIKTLPRSCAPSRRLPWRAFCLAAAAALTAHAGASPAPDDGIQDHVLTARRAAPDTLPAPLSAATATPLVSATPPPTGGQLAPLRAGTAQAPVTDAAQPGTATATRNVPAAHSVGLPVDVRLPADIGLVDPAVLLDSPIVRSHDTADTIVYRSYPGDRLDIAPRFSDRGIARKFDADVGFSAGSGGALRTYGSVTLPLIDDVLSVRISGSKGSGYPVRGTFRESPLRFYDHGAADSSDFGFDLRWAPSDNFNLNVRSEQSNTRLGGNGRH